MYRILLCAMALAMAASARGQNVPDELEQLRQRVDQLEKQAASKPASNAFNPDISLILQGTVARSSQNPDDYQITGFVPTNGEVAPARRGFSLGESELVISSNIDPYFRGQLVTAFTPDNQLEVEEAFFQTLALGRGFTLKGGRFLSSVGYQNQIHQHAWDFQDAPLATPSTVPRRSCRSHSRSPLGVFASALTVALAACQYWWASAVCCASSTAMTRRRRPRRPNMAAILAPDYLAMHSSRPAMKRSLGSFLPMKTTSDCFFSILPHALPISPPIIM